MFDSGDIKMQARNALQNNWGSAVLVSFLCGIMGSVFVLTGPVSTGQCKCYLDRIRNRGPVNIDNLLVYFDGRFFGGFYGCCRDYIYSFGRCCCGFPHLLRRIPTA